MIGAIASVIGTIKGLLGLGTSIVSALADAKIAMINAKTDEERIRAAEQIAKLEIQARTHGRIESVVRAAFAAPFVVFVWKAVVWDKVLQYGITDPLSRSGTSTLDYLLMGIVSYYFLYSFVRR